MLSGDEALSLLAGLAEGKEDELRAKAEAEAQARVDEILGRKRKPKPQPEPTPPPEQELPVEGEMLSGDEALSLLAGLAEGKEDELRAKAEAEAQARVDEILGRKRKPKPEEVPSTPPAQPEIKPPAAQEAEGKALFGWTRMGEPSTPPPPVEEEKEETPPAFGFLQVEEEVKEILPPEEKKETFFGTVDEGSAPRAEAGPSPASSPPPPAAKQGTPQRRAIQQTASKPKPSSKPAPQPAPSAAPSTRDLDSLRAYVKKHRSDHAARLELAQALWKVGEREEALKHYSRLIRAEKTMEQVLADLTAYVEANPADARLLRTLGDAYMKSGDLNQAMALYKQAMDLL